MAQVAGKNQEMFRINLVKQKIIYSSDFCFLQLLRPRCRFGHNELGWTIGLNQPGLVYLSKLQLYFATWR